MTAADYERLLGGTRLAPAGRAARLNAETTKGRGSIFPPNKPRQRPIGRSPHSEVLSLNDKEIVLTAEGLSKLETELDELKTVHRREVNDRIRQAKEYGDLSENAEYEDAKQEQAFIEGRIFKLEEMIRNARLIDESEYRRRRSASRRDRESQGPEERRELRVSRSSVRPKPIRATSHLERIAAWDAR